MINIQRILVAVLIAAGIYSVAAGAGYALDATGTIATGATHNDCDNFREDIADEQGIDEEDVEQSDIKALAIACLETHELSEDEAFRTEYLYWGIWPAVICAVIFLLWPIWSRILHNQEQAGDDDDNGDSHHPPGTNTMQ